jgi:murein DD-endopeptidase MepM/ murein hydrolase activator NlpD
MDPCPIARAALVVPLLLAGITPEPSWGQDSVPAASPDSASRQDSASHSSLRVEPAFLIEGTLGWIVVRPSAEAVVVAGEAAGEPIHFHASDSGFKALIGVPVDVGDSLPISVFLQVGERADTVRIAVPVHQAGYPSEVLAVAPAFVRPDSISSARIRAELARSREVSRRSQQRPRIWRGPFRVPRPSRITSPFGTARVYNGELQGRHLGTDFAGTIGAPVRVAGRGVVAMVADFYLAGRAIYVDHGAGVVTAYFHLSRAYVKEGDTVRAGQRIGAVGQSGRVTGPHLHWVARYGAISVDPMSLLQLEKMPSAITSKRGEQPGTR